MRLSLRSARFGSVRSRLAGACLAAAIGIVALGCAAQNEYQEDTDWTKDRGAEGGKWREVESLFGAEESQADSPEDALRGVRHDLTLAKNAQPDAQCVCLDVGVGRPHQGKFRWAGGERPSISPKNMVVAFRSRGGGCADPSGGRPSIQAVDVVDRDVVVVIENLPNNRPQAVGAIIPKPRHGGALYLRRGKFVRGKRRPGIRGSEGACRVFTPESRVVGVGR